MTLEYEFNSLSCLHATMLIFFLKLNVSIFKMKIKINNLINYIKHEILLSLRCSLLTKVMHHFKCYYSLRNNHFNPVPKCKIIGSLPWSLFGWYFTGILFIPVNGVWSVCIIYHLFGDPCIISEEQTSQMRNQTK